MYIKILFWESLDSNPSPTIRQLWAQTAPTLKHICKSVLIIHHHRNAERRGVFLNRLVFKRKTQIEREWKNSFFSSLFQLNINF